MLTDICDFHHVRIQSGFLCGLPECCLVHTRGTGTYHDSCQIFLFDGCDDFLLPCLRTHILVILGMNHSRLQERHLGNLLYIYRSGDIASAVADKYSYPLHSVLTSCIF